MSFSVSRREVVKPSFPLSKLREKFKIEKVSNVRKVEENFRMEIVFCYLSRGMKLISMKYLLLKLRWRWWRFCFLTSRTICS